MHAQDLQPALQAHLDAQIAAAENLLKTLEDERTALKGADAHALVDAGAAKVAALTHFEELEQGRRLLCQGRDDRATFERLIETLDRQTSSRAAGRSIGPGAMLQATWQRLLELAGAPSADAADALACAICHAHGGQGLGAIPTRGFRVKRGRLI